MDGARGDDAMPPLPSKLDCILRRLIWLGAPKVPYSKTSFDLREASNFKKPIQNLIRLFQFLGIDGCAQVFITVVLLVGYLSLVDVTKSQYQIIELYAGERRLARLASELGQSCAAVDKAYDPEGDNRKRNNCMDINTSGGFTSPNFLGELLTFGLFLFLMPPQLKPHSQSFAPCIPGWLSPWFLKLGGRISCCWWAFAVRHLYPFLGDLHIVLFSCQRDAPYP